MFTCSKRLLHNNFLYQYLSRYSLVSLSYQCLTRIQSSQLPISIATIDPKLKGTILNLFIKTGNHANAIPAPSTPLLIGVISSAIDINKKLVTIDPKLKGLNLLSKAENYTNLIQALSTPLPMGAILSAIDINRKLVTIDPKLQGTILNLFIKTENDYYLVVNNTEFLY